MVAGRLVTRERNIDCLQNPSGTKFKYILIVLRNFVSVPAQGCSSSPWYRPSPSHKKIARKDRVHIKIGFMSSASELLRRRMSGHLKREDQ